MARNEGRRSGAQGGWRGSLFAIVLAASAAAGCASTYESLVPDPASFPDGSPCSLDRTGRVRRIPTHGPESSPVFLEIEERGDGREDTVIVLIHGVFSDRRIWRFVAADLERNHDLLLVDLAGCGGSDAPDPEALGPGGYGPESQARRVLEVLRAVQADRPAPARLVLVGHSLGGAIALRMLGDPALRDEFSDVLGRVRGAVLFSALDASFVQPDPGIRAVAEVSGLEIDLGNLLGAIREKTAVAVQLGVADPSRALRSDAERFAEILSDAARRRALQAMIRSAFPLREDLRPDWERVRRIEEGYRRITLPILLVWGARDETLPCAMGYKLAAQLPNARLAVVADGMHGLPTEHPWTCAGQVRTFLGSGDGTWPAAADADPRPSNVEYVGSPGH